MGHFQRFFTKDFKLLILPGLKCTFSEKTILSRRKFDKVLKILAKNEASNILEKDEDSLKPKSIE